MGRSLMVIVNANDPMHDKPQHVVNDGHSVLSQELFNDAYRIIISNTR